METRKSNIDLKKYLLIGMVLLFVGHQLSNLFVSQIEKKVNAKMSVYQSKTDSLEIVLRFSQDSLKYYRDTLVKVNILIKKLETNKITTNEKGIYNRNVSVSDSTAVDIFTKRYGKQAVHTSKLGNDKKNKR